MHRLLLRNTEPSPIPSHQKQPSLHPSLGQGKGQIQCRVAANWLAELRRLGSKPSPILLTTLKGRAGQGKPCDGHPFPSTCRRCGEKKQSLSVHKERKIRMTKLPPFLPRCQELLCKDLRKAISSLVSTGILGYCVPWRRRSLLLPPPLLFWRCNILHSSPSLPWGLRQGIISTSLLFFRLLSKLAGLLYVASASTAACGFVFFCPSSPPLPHFPGFFMSGSSIRGGRTMPHPPLCLPAL